jgi:hypothetical protein
MSDPKIVRHFFGCCCGGVQLADRRIRSAFKKMEFHPGAAEAAIAT